MVNHDVTLQGPRKFGGSMQPIMLQRTDARFMDTVRAELANEQRHAALADTIVKPGEDGITLYQPIHRTFHLVLLEAFCNVPGKPPLDGAKIDSAGLVVRRRIGGVEWGWMEDERGTRGWTRLASGRGPAVDRDADPVAVRRHTPSTGAPVLDRRLASRRTTSGGEPSEVVTPLFVLPTTVREATGATLLFGTVPTTALDGHVDGDVEPPNAADLVSGFSPYIQALTVPPTIPNRNGTLHRPTQQPDTGPSEGKVLSDYVAFVQQMVVQFDLLGSSPSVQALLAELDQHTLTFERVVPGGGVENYERGLGAHLLEAARVLALPPDDPEAQSSLKMPVAWLVLDKSDVDAIADKAVPILRERLRAMQPLNGQFSEPDARLFVRCFVRVRRDDGCAPKLIWSVPSDDFRVARWFESGPAATPVVELPDPFKQGIKSFKPNIAFSVPSSIADILRDNKPDKLIEGSGQPGSGLGLGWLCGFNIPLITLCAFIVLSIFLSLFNLIFWWLPFIRICIPIPKKT